MKLTKSEQNVLHQYWKSVFPDEPAEEIDWSKVVYFDGEWKPDRYALRFFPDDPKAWDKAKADGFTPIPRQDYVPAMMEIYP